MIFLQLLLLLSISSSEQTDPWIDVDVTCIAYATCILPCTCGASTDNLYKIKNETILFYEMSEDPMVHQLIIPNILTNYAGLYSCQILDMYGKYGCNGIEDDKFRGRLILPKKGTAAVTFHQRPKTNATHQKFNVNGIGVVVVCLLLAVIVTLVIWKRTLIKSYYARFWEERLPGILTRLRGLTQYRRPQVIVTETAPL